MRIHRDPKNTMERIIRFIKDNKEVFNTILRVVQTIVMIIILIIISFNSCEAQRTSADPNLKEYKYITLILEDISFFGNGYKNVVIAEYGQKKKFLKSSYLYGKDDVLEFNTITGVINYMDGEGWDFTGTQINNGWVFKRRDE